MAKVISIFPTFGPRRLATTTIGEVKRYPPSQTELLLEQICRSFDTSLSDAEIQSVRGTAVLVRQSEPVLVTNHNDVRRMPEDAFDSTRKFLLSCQYSRFSMMHTDNERLCDFYRKNMKKRSQVSHQTILERIRRAMGTDELKHVTDGQLVHDLKLLRFRKEIYFAVYDLTDHELPDGIFDIHVPKIHEIRPIEWNEDMGDEDSEDIDDSDLSPHKIPNKFTVEIYPYAHLTLTIPEIFFVHDNKEKDPANLTLTIRYPAAEREMHDTIDLARAVHKVRVHERNNFSETLEFPEMTQRETYMGFVYTFLNKLCRGRTF